MACHPGFMACRYNNCLTVPRVKHTLRICTEIPGFIGNQPVLNTVLKLKLVD